MTYVRDTGLDRARQRKQRRSMIVIAIAAVLAVCGLIIALAYIHRSTSGAATNSCAAASTPPAPQASFVLNVYNSSSDTGAAKRDGTAMRARGFNVGVVSNDPYGMSIKGVGQVRFGPQGKADAQRYVEQFMPGATLFEDGRTGTSVDLVLGDQAPNLSANTPTATAAAPTASCQGG